MILDNKHNNIYSIEHKNPLYFSSALRDKKTDPTQTLTKPEYRVPKSLKPVTLELAFNTVNGIIKNANKLSIDPNTYVLRYMKHLSWVPAITAVPSKSANVGRVKAHTLIDGEQIFDKTIEYIKSAEKSIQVEMFEFQNLKVNGDTWPSNGAEVVPGWEQQQKLLNLIVSKKKANPDLNVQVILDVYKWTIDGKGSKTRKYDFVEPSLIEEGLVKIRDKYRRYNNIKMIQYLKANDIDVVPYPKAHQQGSNIQHVKFLAVDSKKAIIGGMNWGSHSAANHDACIAMEPREYKPGHYYKHTEVDNLIDKLFNQDWRFAWKQLGETDFINTPINKKEQEGFSKSRKKIKAEDIEYMQLVGSIYNKPEYKNRYSENRLNLPKVSPIDNSNIKLLVNRSMFYESINGQKGEESIGNYIKQRVKTAKKLRAELFVLTHKEITNQIIKRYKDAQNGGKPFDVKILVDPGVLDSFPYCRKAFENLEEAGVPIRTYNVDERVNQRFHAKLAVFDDKDILIGSANWSAVGLEHHTDQGTRTDYELTNKLIDLKIGVMYKPTVQENEKELGISSVFNTYRNQNQLFNYKEMINRRQFIKRELQNAQNLIKEGKEESIKNIRLIDSVQIPLEQNKDQLIKLNNHYKELKFDIDNKYRTKLQQLIDEQNNTDESKGLSTEEVKKELNQFNRNRHPSKAFARVYEKIAYSVISNDINENKKHAIKNLETSVGLSPLEEALSNKNEVFLLNQRIQQLSQARNTDIKNIKVRSEKEIDINEDNINKLKKLLGYYKGMYRLEHSKEKYKKGNNEAAILFESKKLAQEVFDKQFNLDWKHSEPEETPLFTDIPSIASFMGRKLMNLVALKKPVSFNNHPKPIEVNA